MTLKEQTEVFSRNLNKYLKERNLTQKEVAEAIGVSQQSMNYWSSGRNLPRMDKIQLLADYLGIRYSDLLYDDVMEETLQEAFDRRPDMRVLFQLAKNCTPEEINLVARMLEAFKNKN